jgi:RNAse (barnase) inhibitor barstar
LAGFIQKLLKEWPQLPAGMTFDFNNYFDLAKCQRILREHLGLEDGQINKDFRALWHVLRAIVWREELRDSLLRLAHHARVRAEQQRKGWQHLQNALEAVFNHICREPSVEEQIRNFERSNFPEMRNLSRERRMQLLPEMGNDPDHSVRDLTKKERMILAERYFKTRLPFLQNPAPTQSFPTQYGRAMKAVRQELAFG